MCRSTVREIACVLRWHAYLMTKQSGCTVEEYLKARDMYDRACMMYLGMR